MDPRPRGPSPRAFIPLTLLALLELWGCAARSQVPVTAENDAFASWGMAGAEAVDADAEARASAEALTAWLTSPADWRTFDAERLEGEVYRQVNVFRVGEGISALKWSPRLAQAARAHSEELAVYGQLSHESPSNPRVGPEDRALLVGLSFRALAENVAMEPLVRVQWESGRQELYTWAEVAANVARGWAESPPHRENLLRKDLRETGLGAALSTQGDAPRVYLTEDLLR